MTNANGNAKKLAQLERMLGEILAVALQRGFFGAAGVEIVIQDGVIQSIRRKVEQVEK
jgi:hypothetical protein